MGMLICTMPILAVGFPTVIIVLALRLRNPGLTETQLFLRFRGLWCALILLNLLALGAAVLWFSRAATGAGP